MKLEIVTNTIDERTAVVTLNGRLDAVTVADLREVLGKLVAGGTVNLVIDLGGTSFIDSSGLAALIYGLKAVREAGGSFRLACLQEPVKEIFRLTMIDRVFAMYPDTASALAAGGKG